jgi:hypothetical protein
MARVAVGVGQLQQAHNLLLKKLSPQTLVKGRRKV